MKPKGTIYEIVDKQRAALLAREYDAVKRIVRAYEKAEVSVEKSIRTFQAKIAQAQAAGLEPSLAWYYQEARLENVLREIRGHLDEYSKDALEFAAKGRDDAYELGTVHALRLAEAQVIGDVAGLHAQAFANASALLAAGSPLKTLFDEIGPTATVSARELFARAVAEGWNPRKLGKALAGEIEGLAKRRGVLIARTEMIRAYRTANTEVFTRNADVMRGWRWMAAKTPATCAMCLALDGEIFPIDQTLSSHPACRCSMLPLPKTDFGGPQPALGEDYFRGLSEAQQNATLGKGKATLYRNGQMTLKDNVRWKDDPTWGRQPTPRRLNDLVAKSLGGKLPSQQGYLKISSFEPIPARSLSDLLDAAERKANDPVEKALEAWKGQTLYPSGHRKITFPSTKPPPYKKIVGNKLDNLESTIDEVDFKDLVSTLPSAPADKVEALIRALGDGPDLPIVFKSGGKLFIHNGESVARLQAKALLGQTKASVRLFDADAIVVARTPLDDAKDAILKLGVKDILVYGSGQADADVIRALAWAEERIKATGVVPKNVSVLPGTGGGFATDGNMIIGTDIVDYAAENLADAIANSYLVAETPSNLYSLKTNVVRVSLDRVENVEAAMFRSKFKFDTSDAAAKVLEDWGKTRYDLLSVRAFDAGQIENALEEAIILYRRGEYRLGSLPAKVEKQFLEDAEKYLGKKKTLPAYSDSENYLFHQTGTQGGSNPGGTYLGRDGVSRYVKFYDNEERGLVEHIANTLYKANGIDVPDSVVFQNGSKKAFATTILEGGKTIQALGGVSGVDIAVLKEAFDGYTLDAFLANWDVVGLSADNMMVVGGKVFRIDNGGTFIFRAQGGDKADTVLQAFEELFSLGGTSSKGHTGQFKAILDRLGYPKPENAVDEITKQSTKLIKTLDKIAKTEPEWIAYFDSVAPGLSANSKLRMAKMMTARRGLLIDKLVLMKANLKALGSAGKAAAKAAKAAQAQAVKDAAAAAKLSKQRAALLAKGKKPLTQAAFDKILKAPDGQWAIPTQTISAYDAWLAANTDHAFDAMPERCKRSLRNYSGSGYISMNSAQRELRKRGTAIAGNVLDHIKNIEDAIRHNVNGLKSDIVVSRKMNGGSTEHKWHNFNQSHVGTCIADSAFQSSSMSPGVWSGDVRLQITLRKGERRFIPPGRRARDGSHGSEMELILANDLIYIIRRVEKSGGMTILHVDVVPEGYSVPKGKSILYSIGSYFAKAPQDFGPNGPAKLGGTLHDSGEYETVDDLQVSLCANCWRKFDGAATCDAFPEGIPLAILLGLADHRKNLPGDLGLAYDPVEPDGEMMTI